MNINFLLFDDFESLDVFGPVEVLGHVEEYTLKYYSLNGGNIKSAQDTIILTEPLKNAIQRDILVIPGGIGTRSLINNTSFINALTDIATQSLFCLSICTGSALLAKTCLLDGKKATSNIKAFDWVKSTNNNVKWIKNKRWVIDGKYYTSAGVSAGIDMALKFIEDQYSFQKALDIATHIEYNWNHSLKY